MSKKKRNIENLLKEAVVSTVEQPYKIPRNWVWSKLAYVFEQGKQQVQPTGSEKYIGLEHMNKGGGILEVGNTEGLKSKKVAFQKNDVLYGKLRPYLNKHAYVEFDGVASTDILVYRNKNIITNKLLNMYVGLPHVLQYANENSSGINLPRVSPKSMNEMPFPLPPLNEQKRIVEKVEKLLNKIEKAKQLIEEAKETFEFRRAAILDKAFRGEMTAKWREGNQDVDSVNMLLEKIKNERSKEKGRKKVTEIKEVTDVPYKLPKGWAWINLGVLLEGKGIFDGPFGSNLKTSDYTESGVRVIRLENIRRLSFDDSKRTYISHEKYNNLKKHTLMEGDIIFSSFISENVRACILPDMETKAINKADCFCIRPNIKAINKEFLLYFLSSNVCYNFLHRQIHGATRPRVNTTQLKALPIPVPPLKEQFEIITHIQKLYKAEKEAFKDLNLENSIVSLKQSILSKAFCGELGTNDPSEENAIELLKEILQEQVK